MSLQGPETPNVSMGMTLGGVAGKGNIPMRRRDEQELRVFLVAIETRRFSECGRFSEVAAESGLEK
jgi:hypothetical protein